MYAPADFFAKGGWRSRPNWMPTGKPPFALLSVFPHVTDHHAPALQRHAACHLLHYAVLAVFIKCPQNVALPYGATDKIINSHRSEKLTVLQQSSLFNQPIWRFECQH
jgi:hypothetical protein